VAATREIFECGLKDLVVAPGLFRGRGLSLQYGILSIWRVTSKGTFPGDDKLSNVTLRDVLLDQHRSIRQKIGIDDRIDSELNGPR
jgi:predicted transcriptional regulator